MAELSVVIVSPRLGRTTWVVLEALRRQTVPVEILLVTEATDPGAPLAGVIVLHMHQVTSYSQAQAGGIRRATAPVVALLDDHAWPVPDWAETLLRDHREYAGVNSTLGNGNPRSGLSWANLLIAYGPWVHPRPPRELTMLSNSNASYRRDVLLAHDAELDEAFERETQFQARLHAEGHRFYLSAARVYHLNASRLGCALALRFQSARLQAAVRCRRGGWGLARRLLYTLTWPAIAALRMWRFRDDLRLHGHAAGMALALAADALGQAVGFALGEGACERWLHDFEVDRWQHLTTQDRADLSHHADGLA